jgi:methionyl-tRNA formyltransferase
MKIIFAGTPEFAAVSLDRLMQSGFEVPLVITQPDRRAGRGMGLSQSAVKQLAITHRLDIYQPETLSSNDVVQKIVSCSADIMVVVAYGQLVPKSLLNAFPFGCVNVHASILPRWRGAAPIHRALMAGDDETGVCIMQLEEGLDTGPVYRMEKIQIESTDTTGLLHDKLAELGARALVETLSDTTNLDSPRTQSTEGATYARKITKDDTVVNWTQNCQEIDRLVRALNPYPGAIANLQDNSVKIWAAQPIPSSGEITMRPGLVLEINERGILVACGEGTLLLTSLQRQGGRRMSAAEFAAGQRTEVGQSFG